MSEENKAIVRRFLDELWNKDNQGITAELATASYPSPGAARELLAAFPDLQLTVDDQIAEGDKVVTLTTTAGTHKEEYQGIAPTNKHISFKGVFVHRLEGGKLADRLMVGTDVLGARGQIRALLNQ